MDRQFCADVYRFLLACVRSTKSKRAILPDKHREQVPWLRQGFSVSPAVVCVLEFWSLTCQWWWCACRGGGRVFEVGLVGGHEGIELFLEGTDVALKDLIAYLFIYNFGVFFLENGL